MTETEPIQYVLTEFLDAIYDQVADEYLTKHENAEIELYFDAADLKRSVLGMYSFESVETFNQRVPPRFDFPTVKQNAFLVDCLALEGLLGKNLKLLYPHLIEFHRLYRAQFLVETGIHFSPYGKSEAIEKYKVENFYKELSHASENDPEMRAILNIRSETFEADLQSGKLDPELLFKFVSSIRSNWRDRFKQLQKWTDLSVNPDFDARTLRYHPAFQPILKVFTTWRPKRTEQNVWDALAMAELATKLESFKAGKSKKLPYFFLFGDLRTSIHLKRMLLQLKLEDTFTYEVQGRKISVLKDWQYYIFRAIFRGAREGDDKELNPQEVDSTLNKVRVAFDEEIRRASLDLSRSQPPDQSTYYNLEDFEEARQLKATLSRFVRTAFLQKILEPFITIEKYQVAFSVISDGQASTAAPEWRVEFKQLDEIRAISTLEALAADSETAKQFFEGFRELETLKLRFRNSDMDDEVLWRNLGLLQMRLPITAKDLILSSVRDLTQHDMQRAQSARVNALKAYYRICSEDEAVRKSNVTPEDRSVDAALVTCLLYVCQLGAPIPRQGSSDPIWQITNMLSFILDDLKELDDVFWKRLLQAIIGLRLYRPSISVPGSQSMQAQANQVREVAAYFSKSSQTDDMVDRGYALIAEALILSLGWRKIIGGAAQNPMGQGKYWVSPIPYLDELHRDALSRLKSAYNIFSDKASYEQRCMRTYVANGLLFVSMRTSIATPGEINALAESFERRKREDPDTWQPLYDDTLSDYYFARSVDALKLGNKNEASLEASTALKYAEKAEQGLKREDVKERALLIRKFIETNSLGERTPVEM